MPDISDVSRGKKSLLHANSEGLDERAHPYSLN